MSDLIKRADAIKALKETDPTVWTGSDYELGQKNQWSLDILAIECLPSADPPPETCWGCNCPKMEESE